jgi:hypothetical protein
MVAVFRNRDTICGERFSNMKTADSIEQQPERKAARDIRNHPDSLRENTEPVTQKRRRGDASYKARIAPFKWAKGFCPNPGGRPKRDLAAEIARACFENNHEALYRAFSKALLKGNAYAFKELADRAFGRLRERVELDVGPYRDMSTDNLNARIAELERELGISSSSPELLPPASEEKKLN